MSCYFARILFFFFQTETVFYKAKNEEFVAGEEETLNRWRDGELMNEESEARSEEERVTNKEKQHYHRMKKQ